MNKFEKMKKTRPFKNNWCDWLINYIPGSITKTVGGLKGKILSFFNANT